MIYSSGFFEAKLRNGISYLNYYLKRDPSTPVVIRQLLSVFTQSENAGFIYVAPWIKKIISWCKILSFICFCGNMNKNIKVNRFSRKFDFLVQCRLYNINLKVYKLSFLRMFVFPIKNSKFQIYRNYKFIEQCWNWEN